MAYSRHRTRLDFIAIADAALAQAPSILARWLPDGRRQGGEWVARNPKRCDRHAGSFRVNLATGRWADFATGEAGGDLIALAAWLFDLRQHEAARRLASMLGVRGHGR